MELARVFYVLGIVYYAVCLIVFVVYGAIMIKRSRKRRGVTTDYLALRERYYELYNDLEKVKRYIRYKQTED